MKYSGLPEKYTSSWLLSVTAVRWPSPSAHSAIAADCTGSLKLARNAPRDGSASVTSVEAMKMIGACAVDGVEQRCAGAGERRDRSGR